VYLSVRMCLAAFLHYCPEPDIKPWFHV